MRDTARLHPLDALRGLFALYVVVYHYTLRYPCFMRGLPMDDTPLLPGLSQAESGVIPVLWFFIVSGFVIAWTVDRSRTPLDFVVSRVSRLYPAYWAALAITLAVMAAFPLPGPAPTPHQVAANITMLQEFMGQPNVDGVYWSLAVELLFYAYALALMATGLWRYVHLVAFAWTALCLLAATATLAGATIPWRAHQLLILDHGPFFTAGLAIYQLWRGKHPPWAWATLLLCALTLPLLLRPVPAATCAIVAALIAWSTRGGLRALATPPLLWLGAISYTLYLSHQIAGFTLIRALDAAGLPHTLSILLAIAAALALATAITTLVERPALRAIRTGWRTLRPPPAQQPGPLAAQAASTAPPKARAAPGSPG